VNHKSWASSRRFFRRLLSAFKIEILRSCRCIFHSKHCRHGHRQYWRMMQEVRSKHPLLSVLVSCCTNSGHRLVERLHSTAPQAHRRDGFLLTLKIEGVKRDRSLTRSKVFPVGAASGTQARSPSIARWKEGQQGSIVKRWSRRTGTQCQRQDRVPRR
jgi:hypothetical protein